MRVLLDECLPAGLRRDLPGHEVTTVQQMGGAGTKNGALLPLVAGAGFAAFVTVDTGIEFQQRVVGALAAELILSADLTRLWRRDR